MEDIFTHMGLVLDPMNSFQDKMDHRRLGVVVSDGWKNSLWERNSVEPAMMRVPVILIGFGFLYSLNFFVFEKMKVPVQIALNVKPGLYIQIFLTALTVAFIFVATFSLFSQFLGYPVEASICAFYAIFTCLCLLHTHIPYGIEGRQTLFKLIKAMCFPGNSVLFSEVLVADALTSVSKVLKDFGTSLCVLYIYFRGGNIVDIHDWAMIGIALLASLPYWIRIRQCWVQFINAPDLLAKFPISLNILKYASGFPPIWLAAAASLGYLHPMLPHWTAVCATINSLFSFLWDVVMDWGLISFTRTTQLKPFCRKRIMFPIYTYPILVCINLCLRFSWVANRVPMFSKYHSSKLIFMVEVAEVCRRWLWNYYRIEWELIVQAEKAVQGKDEEVSVGNSCDKLGISLNGNDSGTGGGNGGSGGGLLGFGGLSSLSLLRSNVSTSNLMGV